MGILGNLRLKRRVNRVVVGHDEEGNAVELVVHAPKLQLFDELQAILPEPVPPIMKDQNGNAIPERDSKGEIVTRFGTTVFQRDDQDKTYLLKASAREQALTIAIVIACLKEQVSPRTTPKDHEGNLVDYYHAVWSEMEDAGIDVGGFKALSEAALSLGSPLDTEEAKEAREALGVKDEGKKGK